MHVPNFEIIQHKDFDEDVLCHLRINEKITVVCDRDSIEYIVLNADSNDNNDILLNELCRMHCDERGDYHLTIENENGMVLCTSAIDFDEEDYSSLIQKLEQLNKEYEETHNIPYSKLSDSNDDA